MNRVHVILRFGVVACLFVAVAPSTPAEEIDKKFRLGFSVGSFDTSGAVPSSAANQRILLMPNGELDNIIVDPRNDSGALSTFGIESQLEGTLSASYAVSRLWYVEASVGYRTGTVGNVQVQAQFGGVIPPSTQSFEFSIFNLDGGTITQVPLELTAGIRFRPKATFNPYLCAGIGYTLMSYSPSNDINQLSINLDRSAGGFARIAGGLIGGEGFAPAEPATNLGGIEVDVPDAPEWHVGGGFEFTVKNRWAIFIDARYYTYSGNFGMTVNGGSELGVSVPNDQVFTTDAGARGPFGAIEISEGGLIDGGSMAPDPLTAPQDPPPDYCEVNHNANCLFTGPPDGVPDPGHYYVQAGDVRYNGLSLQIGFKFTF